MKVFVGWDSREDISYQVCEHSIKRRDPEAEVYPLKQNEMRKQGIYTREIDKLATTEFTFTRFFVPHLTRYKGWAVFCDCDFVWKIPSKELEQYCDDSKAVVCVQHDYTPEEGSIKMDGQVQTAYPRKNWSSMVLWNCGHEKNKILTPEFLNQQTPKFLHRFSWLEDSEIGSLPHEYNWLVGWYKEPKDGVPKILHYTEGGPWFDGYRDCEYADVWKKEVINLFSS